MKSVAGCLSVHSSKIFPCILGGTLIMIHRVNYFSDITHLISSYYLNIYLLLSRCDVPAYFTLFCVWLHDWVMYYWWPALDHLVILLSYIMIQIWYYYALVVLRGNCKLLPKYNCNQTSHCSCCIVTDSMAE